MLRTSHLRALYGFLSMRSTMTTMTNSAQSLEDYLEEFPPGKDLTTDDWKALRCKCGTPVVKFGITSLSLIRHKSIQSSRSLLSFLQSENSLTAYMKCCFLKTLKSHKDFVTPEDHKFIESTVHDICEKYPLLIDRKTAVMILDGISLMPSWKELSSKFTDVAKSKGVPLTELRAGVAVAAFMNRDPDFGFQMLEQIVSSPEAMVNGGLYHEAMTAAMHYISNLDDSKTLETLLWKLLPFSDYCGTSPRLNFAWSLAQCIETKVENWVARFTDIHESGDCACCHRRLSNSCLKEEEFSTLRNKVLENLLVCGDAFIRSSPQEIKRFHDFLKNAGQYTIVIDGLNVFYQVGAYKMKQLIDTLQKNGEIVLILGRKHLGNQVMLRNMFKSVKFFLTDNASYDDTFLLYAALSQGQGTYVLSNDFMGGHRKKIDGLLNVQYLFHKWQEESHVFVNYRTGHVLFPTFTFTYQTSNDGSAIHLPYSTGGTNFIFSQSDSKTWLCLQNVGKERKKAFVKEYPLTEPGEYKASTRRQVNHRNIVEFKERKQYYFTLVNYPGKRVK